MASVRKGVYSKKPQKPQYSAKVEDFVKEYRSKTGANFVNPRERYWPLPEDVLVLTELWPHKDRDAVHLATIRSDVRGGGHASGVLRQICDMADKHGVTLDLDVKPFGRGGLSKRDLAAWYARYGFVKGKADTMTREPE
jgi:hypothetical protein